MQQLTPLYQGQIDIFCAIYAVLNALRHTHGLRKLACRKILHDTLLDLARVPHYFAMVLDQRTSYVDLVDHMLNIQCKQRPLFVQRPFMKEDEISAQTLWHCLDTWLGQSPHHMAVFRFIRYDLHNQPYIFHWTCGTHMTDAVLSLADSSLDEGSVQRLSQDQIVTELTKGAANTICLEAHSLRLLCPTRLYRKS